MKIPLDLLRVPYFQDSPSWEKPTTKHENLFPIPDPRSPLPLIPRGGPTCPFAPNPQRGPRVPQRGPLPSPIPNPRYPLSPEGAPPSPIPIFKLVI
jgi:hypothetical protein